MKKIILVFFTLLYLVSTSGITLSNFYCCGKLKETYIFSHHDYGKNCKGSKKPGCCDTKTVCCQVKDNHSPSTKIKVGTPTFNVIIHTTALSLFTFQNLNSETLFSTNLHAPPLLSKQPVYLAVSNLRI